MTDSDSSPNVQNPAVTWTIHYRRGTLRRKDSIVTGEAPDIEQIANCETRTGFLIDIKAQQFRRYNLVRFMSEAQRTEYLREAGKKPIPVDSETVDTGERKMLLGYAAKHFITTTTRVDGHGEQEIIDGWYIDHPAPDDNCVPDFVRTEPFHVIGTALVTYPDVPHFQHSGPLPRGLALKIKVTFTGAGTKSNAPKRTVIIERTVEELSDSPLSPSLFELPRGLRENPQLF